MSAAPQDAAGGGTLAGYNFAYLDEDTKRMIRRALLKAVAIPGHQVPFGSREMPLPYGWGTGGIQVTASVIGPDDTLKVIDQGADDTTNAVSIRRFFGRVAGVATTERTAEATVIQTRHRIPETPLREGQILVYQVPMPEPLFRLEPRVAETRRLHALGDYGLMHVKLYEDIARRGEVTISYNYPVMVNGRYLMSPSPIPPSTTRRWTGCRPCSSSARGGRSASTPCRPTPLCDRSTSRTTLSGRTAPTPPARSAAAATATSTRS
jgi:alpha-D-ribose 1-methylphosphonate 5-phosphate C-P lyase